MTPALIPVPRSFPLPRPFPRQLVLITFRRDRPGGVIEALSLCQLDDGTVVLRGEEEWSLHRHGVRQDPPLTGWYTLSGEPLDPLPGLGPLPGQGWRPLCQPAAPHAAEIAQVLRWARPGPALRAEARS